MSGPSSFWWRSFEGTDPLASTITQTTDELGPPRRRVSDLTIDRACFVAVFLLFVGLLNAPQIWRYFFGE